MMTLQASRAKWRAYNRRRRTEQPAKVAAHSRKWLESHRDQKRARDRAWAQARPGYASWKAMMVRCHHPGAKTFAKYGARGIKVYPAWHKYSFFAAHCLDGWRPGYHLHRPDASRGYEPGNLAWVEPSEHARITNRARWGTPDTWDNFDHDILNLESTI